MFECFWDGCVQNCSAVWKLCHNLATPSYWLELLLLYKYWIVAVGALIEGEVVLMMAAASAYHGHISVYYVAVFAAVGAIVHDHVLFLLGRLFKDRFARLKQRRALVQRVDNLLTRYGVYFVCAFRFLYGVRTLTPLLLGASRRFTLAVYSLCVCVSAVIWACLITYLGYTFAVVFDWLVETFAQVKSVIVYGVLGVTVMLTSWFVLRRMIEKRGAQKEKE